VSLVADLDARLAEYTAAVDAHLRAVVDAAGLPPDLAGMLHYHLGWVDEAFRPVPGPRGKLVRPAVCLLACEAAGGDWQQALPSAAAIELVHNFSLVHDDIEDESPVRRHRPSLWALWGVPRALNAGDLLFALAQLALLGDERTAAGRGLAAHLLNTACAALCVGQHRDLAVAAGAEPSLAEYLAMIEGKTAALVRAAAELGALAAGADPARRTALGEFGRSVGLAFQLQDDLLDVWGNATQTGKPARADLRARKHSLPIVLAYDRASPAQRARLQQLYVGPPPLPEPTVAAIVAEMEALGVPEAAARLVHQYYDAAFTALDRAACVQPAGELLRALAYRLLGREA
jgi:geranylgeranyl diphosphate synthase type I